jgi:predicted metal-binding protein
MIEGDLALATQARQEPGCTIHVCTVCRRQREDLPEGYDQPGIGLAAALSERMAGSGIAVAPVECLAVCKRPCTIALTADGKWTYLIGDLDAGLHLDEIVGAAESFAASANGIVPWKERPVSFRKGVVARVPPLPRQQGSDQ